MSGNYPNWLAIKHKDDPNCRLYCVAPLGRFAVADSDIVGIRDAKAYGEKELESLAESMNAKGKLRMQNPPHAWLSNDGESLIAAGGNRRVSAALMLLRKKMVPAETEVACYVLTGDRAAVLAVAARDNSNRVNYGDLELYRQILLLHQEGIGKEEIASTVGMDVRTVERFLAIHRYPVLVNMMEQALPYTKLARLAEQLDKRVDAVRAGAVDFLEGWLATDVPMRIAEEKMKASRANRTLKQESLTLNKLLREGEFEGWERDLQQGEVPTGKPKVKAVVVTADRSSIKVGGISLDLDKATWTEIREVLISYEAAIPVIRAAMVKKKTERSVQDIESIKDELRGKYASDDDDDVSEAFQAEANVAAADPAAGFDEDAS